MPGGLLDILALAFRYAPVVFLNVLDQVVDAFLGLLGAAGLIAVEQVEGQKTQEKPKGHAVEE